uniref:transmembrane protein 45B-like n=1 Tax=Myxine glutinosa TaxID=7769 RepID=UPI00358FEC37
MANFKGHALPGSFFFLFGLWWAIKYPLKHAKRQRKDSGTHGVGGTTCLTNFRRIELVEGIVKTAFSLIGMMAEQFVPDGPHMRLYDRDVDAWFHPMNWQHTTMYLFFMLSGLADIITYGTRLGPPALDRLMLSVAVFVEGLLFAYHLHGRATLDVHVHSLLLYAVFGGAAVVFLEIFVPNRPCLELLRSSLAMIQGTWFYQIGFVLFPPNGGPEWNAEDHGNVTFITMCFCWHIFFNLLLSNIIFSIVTWLVRCRSSGVSHMHLGTLFPASARGNKENGSLLDESEEDE